MKKTKSLAFTVLTVLLTLSLLTLSASATTVTTFTLSAQSTQLQYLLPAETTFNGSISTTGTVRFWVSAPNGSQIVNLGLVDKAATFGFVAQQDGNYTLNFENDLPNQIQVTFSYQTNPDISDSNNSTSIPLIYLSIPLTTAVVGSILIIVLGRRKRKNQTGT